MSDSRIKKMTPLINMFSRIIQSISPRKIWPQANNSQNYVMTAKETALIELCFLPMELLESLSSFIPIWTQIDESSFSNLLPRRYNACNSLKFIDKASSTLSIIKAAHKNRRLGVFRSEILDAFRLCSHRQETEY